MARKPFQEEPEQTERWLISYADFITLLFAFFVVMYAISSVNEGKYRVFSDSLGSAFGGSGTQTTAGEPQVIQLPNIIQRKRAEAARRERERLARISADLASALGPLVKAGKVRITQTAQGILVDIDTSVLFEEGDAALQLEALDPLRQVAAVLRSDKHAIQVEGHTDTTPIATPRFASNWELSAVRAGSVVRLLADAGIAPARLTVLGYGDTRPVASNATPTGRARNRRVAITILAAP
ncbi:flagellar motor protein MotD [Pseudoduganella sp. GCM10020061]|uniref:flagellar motor protein MotD n=1 Tax=Pseudoduganella sp. GCM10020061 TaxID=3317345 RepID=UPI0036338582